MGLSDSARSVLRHADAHAARLGLTRLVCIDGPSGSGKTSLAAAISAERPDAVVLPTDAMLEGWGGLPGLGESLATVMAPLRQGRPGRWREWDWHLSAWARWHQIEPRPMLVVEGVGAAAAAIDPLITTSVWVQAPSAVRLERAVARDGEAMRPALERWAVEQDALHLRENTLARADVVISRN